MQKLNSIKSLKPIQLKEYEYFPDIPLPQPNIPYQKVDICNVPLKSAENYTRQLQLKDNGDYVVYWKVSGFSDSDEIIFEIHARTLGWIGFGLSPNGGMPGADIVIGGLDDQSGQPYLYVSFIKIEN